MSAPEWSEKIEQDEKGEENESQKDYFKNNKDEVLIVLIAGPSGCGKLANPKIERDIVVYNCSCGLVLDRDVNATENILYFSPENRLETLPTELV